MSDLRVHKTKYINEGFYIAKLINEPLLSKMPSLDQIKEFLYI